MSYRYVVIGMIMMLAAAQVLATANVQGPGLKSAPSLEAFGVVIGNRPTFPACPAAADGHFDSVAWSRHGSKSCLEVEIRRWTNGKADIRLLHLGDVAASGWFPASCTYSLVVLDGRIVSVSVTTDETVASDKVTSILVKHYGAGRSESRTRSVSFINGKWTKKSLIHAEWRFSDLYVRYNGQDDGATTGQVDILTPAFDAWYRKHVETKPKSKQTKRGQVHLSSVRK